MERLISIAAGVTPELATDPATFVSAAGAAGWTATGVWFDPETWTAQTTNDVARRVQDLGLVAVDMEVVRMGPDGDCGEALIDAAQAIGARNVLTISQFAEPQLTASRLAELCDHASGTGIRVCLEFMRFTSVKSLADALAVVALTGRAEAGVLVDALHVDRSGTTYDEVRRADPALFPYAQWCDGPEAPRGWDTRSIIGDALDDRSIPGSGQLPMAEFVDAFDIAVPFSLEVRSAELRDGFPDPVERAAHVLEGTTAALRRHAEAQ